MLEHIFERWKRFEGTSAEVMPNINPLARTGSYPRLCSQAGYHMADTACPISVDIWSSAFWSAWGTVEAAEPVLLGKPAAYALWPAVCAMHSMPT